MSSPISGGEPGSRNVSKVNGLEKSPPITKKETGVKKSMLQSMVDFFRHGEPSKAGLTHEDFS